MRKSKKTIILGKRIPNVIFSRELSDTDLRDKLAIPNRSLADFPAIPEGQNHVFVPVMDAAGRTWNFRLSMRIKGHFRKPVISHTDWNSYVTERQLRVGDRITFYRENGEANQYRIRVDVPAFRLFGRPAAYVPKKIYLDDDKGDEDKNGSDGGDEDKNGSDGGDDGNNGGGGGGGSGGNNKKESRDREGDSNGDQDKRSRDDGGGDVKGKNMDFMCRARFGYNFTYHAGYENGYPVEQLKYVQVVQ